MKSIKWRKWRLSKYRFPTFTIKGSKPGEGSLVVGRNTAKEFLKRTLSARRVDAMTITDTAHEWVFMEPIKSVA